MIKKKKKLDELKKTTLKTNKMNDVDEIKILLKLKNETSNILLAKNLTMMNENRDFYKIKFNVSFSQLHDK